MTILKNFVVLEGIDGSGTTTLLKNLTNGLSEKGIQSTGTCEPTDMPIGKLIRSVLRKEYRIEPFSLAQLFCADRREHVKEIQNLLEKGMVISDRYLFSSLAYQSIDSGWDLIWDCNKSFPLPEKMVFLDLPPETAQSRMNNRGEQQELFEDLPVQDKIIHYYYKCLDFFQNSPMKILKMDGSLEADVICKKVLDFILQ